MMTSMRIAETFTAGFDLDGISGISAGAVDSVTVTIISEDTTVVAFVESTLSVIEEIASARWRCRCGWSRGRERRSRSRSG